MAWDTMSVPQTSQDSLELGAGSMLSPSLSVPQFPHLQTSRVDRLLCSGTTVMWARPELHPGLGNAEAFSMRGQIWTKPSSKTSTAAGFGSTKPPLCPPRPAAKQCHGEAAAFLPGTGLLNPNPLPSTLADLG